MDIAMSISRIIYPYFVKSIALDPSFISLGILIVFGDFVALARYLQLSSQVVA